MRGMGLSFSSKIRDADPRSKPMTKERSKSRPKVCKNQDGAQDTGPVMMSSIISRYQSLLKLILIWTCLHKYWLDLF